MTNNEILEAYLPFLKELFAKWHISDDCQQMCCLAVLQKDNQLLNKLHSRKELRYWLVKMIKLMWFSPRSTYNWDYNRYYDKIIELTEDIDWSEEDL